MATHPRAALALALLLLSAACSAAPRGPETGEMRPRRDADRLTRFEISESSATTALDAIQLLRPRWLQKRGQFSLGASGGEIMVYLDNVRHGTPGVLSSLPASSVQSMQFLDGPTATQRYGTNHVHGAILVQTASGG